MSAENQHTAFARSGVTHRIPADERPDREIRRPDPCIIFSTEGLPEEPSLADLVANAGLAIKDDLIPDQRAGWHRNTIGTRAWLRAHVLRLAKGWRSKRLADYFAEHSQRAVEYGFHEKGDGLARFSASPPSQSRLWEVYNEAFTESVRELCRKAAEEAVEMARANGIPAPDGVFQPEDRNVSSERGKQKLTTEKAKEVWQQTKPFVTDTFGLKRAQNAQIHENAFWEQHAFMGMRQDMYAEGGAQSFAVDTQRERTPTGSNHRIQLQRLDIEEMRSMLRETTRMLIARARHNSELSGKLTAAIDITKGNPFTGDRDGHKDVILGYKGGEYHYQWATIQIVGHDIPLVLDAVPVTRGFSRDAIVDELLENALDLVGDIELVMMDREFDSDDIKQVCENHGVYYLNPARKHSSERAMCTRLRQAGMRVHVEEQTTVTGSSRKRMYLPARNRELFATEDTPPEESDENLRQELVTDFAEIGEAGGIGDESPFSSLLDDMHEQEGELPGSEEDKTAYALFETNHPSVSADDGDTEDGLLASVRGIVGRYSQRWGIENGYKQLKQFRVRTTSKNPAYRFFCFAFAVVLYNVWRIVDLLVKLAIDGENAEYAPMVDANRFLTIAKRFYGLVPPD